MSTTFTKDAPFEFEGVEGEANVWRNGDLIMAGTFGYPRVLASAFHAFVEAERNAEWAWTNDDHTEARKGRWTAALDCDVWVFGHDDFNAGVRNLTPYWTRIEGTNDGRVDDVAAEIMDSFDTWHAAQAPAFKPLDVPEDGQYIRATLRNGTVVEGEVTWLVESIHYTVVFIDECGVGHTINITEYGVTHIGSDNDITAWHPIARPLSTPQSDDRGARLAGLVDCVKESGCAVEIEGVRISSAEVTK